VLPKLSLSKERLRSILLWAASDSFDDETLWHRAVGRLWEECGERDPYSSGRPYNNWFDTLQAVLAGRFEMNFVPTAELYNEALNQARTSREWKGTLSE
jgi:hypothetical protein